MKLCNEKDVVFKYGTFGPKYLFTEDAFSGGVAYITAGEELKEHLHEDETEVFYFINGTPLFIIDGSEKRVKPGDGFTVFSKEKHCVKNDTKETISFVFVKVNES